MSTLLSGSCCCRRCFLRQVIGSFLTEFITIWVVFDFVLMSDAEIVATSSVFRLRPRLTGNDSLLTIGFISMSCNAIELFVSIFT